MKRVLISFALPLLAACGGGDLAESCRWLDQSVGGPGATVVSLAPASFVELSNAGTEPATIRVREGETAFSARDPACVAGPDQICSYDVERLRVVINGFRIGGMKVSDFGLLLDGPATLEDRGQGLDLHGMSEVSACARFDGELVEAERTHLGSGTATIGSPEQEFSLSLAYTVEFELNDAPPVVDLVVAGAKVRLSGALSGAGERPWTLR